MNRQYTALGGLAMMLVVLNHSILMMIEYGEANGLQLTNGERLILGIIGATGYFAVPIFLFVSGAFIAYSAKGKKSISQKFLVNNLKRLLRPYIFWSIIFYLLVNFTRNWQYTFWGYIKNLVVGFPYHFVPLILFFYLLSPILLLFGRKYPKSLLTIIASYQLLLLVILDPTLVGQVNLPDQLNLLVPPIISTTMAKWGIFFVLGMVMSLHNHKIKPHLKKYKWVLGGGTASLFALLCLDLANVISTKWPICLTPVLFVFLLPIIDRKTIPGVKYLEQIGKNSYTVYLMHLIIIELSFIFIQIALPGLFTYPLLVLLITLFVGIEGSLFFKQAVKRSSFQKACLYIF